MVRRKDAELWSQSSLALKSSWTPLGEPWHLWFLPSSFINFPQGKWIPERKFGVRPRLGHDVHKQKPPSSPRLFSMPSPLASQQLRVCSVLMPLSLHFTSRNTELVGPLEHWQISLRKYLIQPDHLLVITMPYDEWRRYFSQPFPQSWILIQMPNVLSSHLRAGRGHCLHHRFNSVRQRHQSLRKVERKGPRTRKHSGVCRQPLLKLIFKPKAFENEGENI